jgi:uncharacterized membrane protein
MSYFKAFTFIGKNSANDALDKLEWNDDSYYWLDDVAEISVNKRGTYRVHSTWAQDSSNVPGGIGYGALVGGLIGSLLGPAGTAAGAAMGGSMGGLIGSAVNLEFNDPVLDTFAASLLPDTSALVIIGDLPTIAAVTAALVEYDVQIFDAVLGDDAEQALRNALS